MSEQTTKQDFETRKDLDLEKRFYPRDHDVKLFSDPPGSRVTRGPTRSLWMMPRVGEGPFLFFFSLALLALLACLLRVCGGVEMPVFGFFCVAREWS